MGVKIQILALVCIIIPAIVADGDHYPCEHRWSSDTLFSLTTDMIKPIHAKSNNNKADLLVSQAGNLRTVISSKPSGLFDTERPKTVQQSNAFCDQAAGHMTHIGDMDGDGYDDLLCRKADGTFSVRYHRVNNFMAEQDYAKDFSCASVNFILLGDFDGNRADDILCYNPTFSSLDSSPLYFSQSCHNGRSSSSHHHHNSRHGKTSYGRYQAFKLHRGSNRNPHCDQPMDTSLATGALAKCNIVSGGKIMVLDANGDGMDDIACFVSTTTPNANEVHTYLSVGARNGLIFSTQSTGVTGCPFATSIVVPADIDGDGDDDLLCLHNDVTSTDNIKVVFYKMGGYEATGFSDTNTNLCSPAPNLFCHDPAPAPSSTPHYEVGDFNGDGDVDIMCRYDASGAAATGPIKTRIVYSEHFKP